MRLLVAVVLALALSACGTARMLARSTGGRSQVRVELVKVERGWAPTMVTRCRVS